MKNLFLATLILSFGLANTLQAQSCRNGEKMAQRTFERIGRPWKPNISLIPYQNKVKKMIRAWNYIAGNRSSTIGPRFLEIDGGNETGSITGQTQSTFVTPPTYNNTMKITINKYDGRAETKVVICSHGEDGISRNLKTFTFPNDRNGKTKTFTLTGVKGKIITVAMKNKSVANKFKYRINAK